MKHFLPSQAGLFMLCMAVAFTLTSGRSARAQEVMVDGSTTGSRFIVDGAETSSTNGMTFTGTNFGGTTTGGVLVLNQPNNNLGTIRINTGVGGEYYGAFRFDVLFNLPYGFSANPVSTTASVIGYIYVSDGFVLLDFPNAPQPATFRTTEGAIGVFSIAVDDACFNAGGAPCGAVVAARLRQLRESALASVPRSSRGGDGKVMWLKTKGSPGAYAAKLLSNSNVQEPIVIPITLTGTITLAGGGTAPPNACTHSQGYYKSTPNAIPDVVASSGSNSSTPFRLRLGTGSYTKQQLLSIYNTPVDTNGLISLAYQLITAKLNAGGGSVPTAVAEAITQADALVGDRVVPPVGAGYLDPSATSSLIDLLTRYNEGRIAGASPCR